MNALPRLFAGRLDRRQSAPGPFGRAPHWVAGAGFAVVLSGTQAASAQPVRLRYQGDPTCSDRLQLEHEVIVRNPSVRWASPTGDALEADVTVTTTPAGTTGTLVMRPPGSAEVTREIRGRDCDEVLEAIGLIIALSSIEREQKPPSPEAAPAPSPPPPSEPSLPEPARRWAFGGGVQAAGLMGVAPSPMLGVSAFLDVTRSGEGFSPSLRLGVQEAIRTGLREPEGTTSFRLAAAAAEICPLALGSGESWLFRPCVHGSYGSLRATGSVAGTVSTERHPWAMVGGALRVEWAWSRIASAELAGGPEAALVRSRFFLGERVFHETATVAGWLGVGLVVRLD